MTTDLLQKDSIAVVVPTASENHPIIPTSPPLLKVVPNPQQGMTDPAASVGAITAATATNTASCSSPLTVTSLEAAAAAGTAAANKANGAGAVPRVVSQVVQSVPELDSLSAPMANLGLYHGPMAAKNANGVAPSPLASPPLASSSNEEKKMMCIRTPPTEHDNRKLFVGGLPTDVQDRTFLEFFKQFGEVIDSVVMVDRVTKRSRGFGFVTFATESDANSLLTTIPCKTGYVIINGKQCEVKASTPKKEDAHFTHGKHHGIPGMWKSNPPQHDMPREVPGRRSYAGPHVQLHQRGDNMYYADNEYNGNIDGRNFNELYVQQQQTQMASYQAMHAYSPAFAQGKPFMSHHNNQNNGYPPASAYGVVYSNSSAAAPVPSSWEASHPAPSQGYAQYPSNNGYHDPYAQQYANQYASPYGHQSMPTPYADQAGYTNSDESYAEGGGPNQGANVGSGGYEHYPQSYAGDGQYDQSSTADQNE